MQSHERLKIGAFLRWQADAREVCGQIERFRHQTVPYPFYRPSTSNVRSTVYPRGK